MAATTRNCGFSFSSSMIMLMLLCIFFVFLLPATARYDLRRPLSSSSRRSLLAMPRNPRRQQISSCSQMASRSQCSQDPSCRWCVSEALDDMCFSKTEAWRLPQQVFVCHSL